jgi:hypothetical protein
LQNTEPAILADQTGLITARNKYEEGKDELDKRINALGTLTTVAKGFLTTARDVLKPALGTSYSQAWDATGFVGSLEVPRTADELQPIVQSMTAYLTGHPNLENEKLNVTAPAADTLFKKMETAQNAINEQETEVGNLLKARDAKVRKLRKRLRGLADELDQLIEPLDSRWLAFGLNLPGAEERPDAPENVKVSVIGNTNAALTWEPPARAEHYRVWRKIVGVDEQAVAVGSPSDPNFTLEALPADALVELAVSAVNNGGEGERSPVVTVKIQ